MHEPITTTTSSTNSVGIIIFDARSMPLRTPCIITKWVSASIATVQNTGRMGEAENSWKYWVMYCGLPLSSPNAEAKMYCRHHPDTTA